MKLNKVRGGRETRAGAPPPWRAQHSWGSAQRASLFPSLPGGHRNSQAAAWRPGARSLGGAEVGEVGVLQGLLR